MEKHLPLAWVLGSSGITACCIFPYGFLTEGEIDTTVFIEQVLYGLQCWTHLYSKLRPFNMFPSPFKQ